MHNTDFETFLSRIKPNIDIATIYSRNSQFPMIARACRLKPLTVLQNAKLRKSQLETNWVDEFGILLTLGRGSHKISKTNLHTHSTDLFLSNPSYDNKCIMQLVGDSTLYLSLGRDEYLRASLYFDNKNFIVSPLLAGLEAIQLLFKNRETKRIISDIDTTKLGCLLPIKTRAGVIRPSNFLDNLQ